MAKRTVTYAIAHAAAWDAGNRSMRSAGRERWSDDDYRACSAEFERLWPLHEHVWQLPVEVAR